MNPYNNNCPHCGAPALTGMIAKAAWECGNAHTASRTPLCREREAHQRTMGENHILRDIAARALAITKTWNVDYEEVEKIEEALDVIRGIKP